MIHSARSRQKGHALFLVTVVTATIMGLALTTLTIIGSSSRERGAATSHTRRLYVAEAGIQRTLMDLGAGGAGALGTLPFGGGTFSITTTNNGDGSFTVLSRGQHNGAQRVLEAVVVPVGRLFDHAVFAGNSSLDPTYALSFEGTAPSQDMVTGDLYSGQDISITGNAVVTGSLRASGSIHGASGTQGISQPIPDITAMQYEVNHDVNVAQEMLAHGVMTNNAAGGTAYQLPEANPAHIFRKNPDDRTTETQGTVKDDFFLEDPYEPVRVDPLQNGTDPYKVTVTGVAGRPGPNGSNLVYYIDGNLWIHNLDVYSFQFYAGPADNVRVTIVVKGNIYISDSIFYENPADDGLALIAMKDPNVSDSGNVYFGDPVFGTLNHMDAYMYAENNFHDNNIVAAGSQSVYVRGMMSAGNQVAINRTQGTQHSQLIVHWDDRVSQGTISLPGLPGQTGPVSSFRVASWREVSPQQ